MSDASAIPDVARKPMHRMFWLQSVALADVSPKAMRVAAALAHFCNDVDGRCDPQRETLARVTGMHKTTVSSALSELLIAGFIAVRPGSKRAKQVDLLLGNYADAAWRSGLRDGSPTGSEPDPDDIESSHLGTIGADESSQMGTLDGDESSQMGTICASEADESSQMGTETNAVDVESSQMGTAEFSNGNSESSQMGTQNLVIEPGNEPGRVGAREPAPQAQPPPGTQPDPEKFQMTMNWTLDSDVHEGLTKEFIPELGVDPFWRQVERFMKHHCNLGTVDTQLGFSRSLQSWLRRANANRENAVAG